MAYIVVNEINEVFHNKITSKSILKYVEKHLNEDKKNTSLFAFNLLYDLILKYFKIDINELTLKINEYGKPYFDTINFNLSHSNQLLALGVSKNKIGIDIQQIIDIKDELKLAKRIFNEEDFTKYKKAPSLEFLLTEFSKKEAYLKYLGIGIFNNKIKTHVDKYYLNYFKDSNNNNYILSCCCDEEIILL